MISVGRRSGDLGALCEHALTSEATLLEQLTTCVDAIVSCLGALAARIWLGGPGVPAELYVSAGHALSTAKLEERLHVEYIIGTRQPLRIQVQVGCHLVGVPAIAGGRLVGVLIVLARKPLTPTRMGALESSLDLMAAAIEHNTIETVRERMHRAAKRLSAQVQPSEQAAQVDAADFGSWEMDLRTGVVNAGAQVKAMFGVPPDGTLTVDKAKQRMSETDASRLQQRFEAALRGVDRGKYELEYHAQNLAGEWRWLYAAGQVLFDALDQPRRFLGIVLDITPRKTAEELTRELLAAERAALETSERQREYEQQLVGIVSHDLRTPMQAILFATEVLLGSEDIPPAELRTVAQIKASAERVTRLIHDLLDFTQVRLGGGLKLEPRPVDLHGIATEVVAEIRSTCEERQLRLARAGDVKGVWDRDRLSQAISNLVVNALKYGDRARPVTVSVKDEAGAAEVAVHNFGAPIDPQLVPQLFLPMRRASADHSGPSRSVGLGLYIVEQIAKAHGGGVEVTSNAGEGTTFRIRLPRS